jgi:hypothetical protein
MQGPLGQEKIIERVSRELSGKMKVISVKLHDFVYRKKLFVKGGLYRNYCLMRVKLTLKQKRDVVRKNVIIYPCDVVPYVRKSLDVIEEMVRVKLQKEQSYWDAGNVFYEKYNFDLNSIKSAVKMAEKAFSRLLTCNLAEGIDLVSWISCETRSFACLNHLYRKELLRCNIFAGNLFR